MFNIFVGIFRRGGCTISKSQNTHKRAAAPQHATDHGDRGARGSIGSCSANGPGGSRIFANYCCAVRACARGQICGLTSRQHLEKIYLVPISTLGRDETPLFGGFSDLGNCQNQRSSPQALCTDRTVGESCRNQDLWPTSGYHKQWPEESGVICKYCGLTNTFTRGVTKKNKQEPCRQRCRGWDS